MTSAGLTIRSAQHVHAALDWATLDTALTAAFAVGAASLGDEASPASVWAPPRHVHALGGADVLLLMPAWNANVIGLKVVTVLPNAPAHGAPTVGASYVLLDRVSGVLLAMLDGDAITVRRTAAVSAIAARYLARDDATTLLVIGTGHLAPWMVRAHCALRPQLSRVLIWGRDATRAASLADTLCSEGLPVQVAPELEAAVRSADVVSCVTTAHAPIVHGAWLTPGTHLDLVGGFTRAMREVDDAAVSRSRIAVDTYTALDEAGDLLVPLEQGLITRERVVADLTALVRGTVMGRTSPSDITLFKSVGTALADLAAATAVG